MSGNGLMAVVKGPKGELDAWLELHDEDEVRAAILAAYHKMPLRDDFAAKALVGLLSGSPDADCGPDGYAKDAYMFADAMLKAREES